MQPWREFWRGQIGQWIIERGLRVAMVLIAAVLVARFVSWVTGRIIRRIDDRFAESDELVRSEATKYHRSVTSVIQWTSYCLLGIWVLVQISDILRFSVGGLIAPAAVLGAALGFGAQQLVKDLLSGFFIIAEKQYGFGDLVTLTIAGSQTDATGTVEKMTLRVTRLRSANGEMLTIPNGQIVKSVNQSRDWARAVVDIPVPATVNLNRVNEVLHQVSDTARDDPTLKDLLLDAPTVMGVEKIEIGIVTLRLVARTLPGKQFEVTRELRLLVVRALAHIGIVTADDATAGTPQ